MTQERKNIKTYTPILITFFTINCAVFVYINVSGGQNLSDIYNNIIDVGIYVAAAPLAVFILNGLLSSDNKARLVFLKVKNVYPAHKAFSHYALKDSRVDVKALSEKYGQLPKNPKEQNKLWYKIYKQNEFAPQVFEAQKKFLLCRDMVSLSALFALTYIPVSLYLGGWRITILVYFVFILLQHIMLTVACQNYSKAYVTNVLAIASIWGEE